MADQSIYESERARKVKDRHGDLGRSPAPPNTGHAYRSAVKNNDYRTVGSLARTETGGARDEADFVTKVVKQRFNAGRKRGGRSRAKRGR